MATLDSIAAVLFIIALLIAGYFLPTIIARKRHHRNIQGIFVLNLLLGWTLIGWVGALVWAVIHENSSPPQITRPDPASQHTRRPSPFCAELIIPAARI